MTQIDAFILIGGRSSRLGTNKALVRLGGMTLAELAVDVTRRALSSERVTMVAGSSTQFPIDALSLDVPFIFDLYEGRGPLGGLHAALAYAQTSWIFLLACDYPFVSAELIRTLREEISDEFGAVVPRQADGRLQPLCAFYNVKRARPVVEEIILNKKSSPPMHEIVRSLNSCVVSFEKHSNDEVDPFTNINNAEDLDLAEDMERDQSITPKDLS
jgi:molybdopterin-guanine dinucleotide biosynthesis protein A